MSNYAVNNSFQNYARPTFDLLQNQDRTIITSGPGGLANQTTNQFCSQRKTGLFPLNAWAKQVATQASVTRMNIDGDILASNACYYSCGNTGDQMYNPVPFQPNTAYFLPGGVISAIKFFQPCSQAL